MQILNSILANKKEEYACFFLKKLYNSVFYTRKNKNMTIYEGVGERIDTRLSKQFSYSRSFFHHIIER